MSGVYSIWLDGTEFPVLKDNIDLNKQANWQSTLAVDLPSYDGTYRPAMRTDVVLKLDGVPVFGGILSQAPEQGLGGPALQEIVHHVNAVGYNAYFSYRYVTETIPAGTTLKAALIILATYLPADITLDPAQVTGPNLSQDFPFTRTRLDECLKALTGDTGYLAEIDPSKLFRMRLPSGNPAPFDILDTGPTEIDDRLIQIGDLVVERTLDDNYANRIFGEVRGAGPATDSFSFVWADGVSAGGFRRFTVKYPASQSINDMWPNVLTINGVVVGPVVWGAPTPNYPTGLFAWGWDYTQTPAQLIYNETFIGYPVPVGADVLSGSYAIGFPFYVTGNNVVDQATNPIKEAMVSIDEALSVDAAQAYVDALVTQRSAVLERVRYTTEQTTLEPGMTQTITVAKRGINASCLITEVHARCEPERSGDDLLYDITAVVGTSEAGNVRSTYKDWLRQGGTGPSRTGVAGASVAPPLRSVQFNDDGAFGGHADVLIDKDATGDAYASGIPSHKPARLAVFSDDYSTIWQMALGNRAAGITKAMIFDQLDDGTQYIEHRGPGLFFIEHLGDFGAYAGGDVSFETGESTSNAIKLKGLTTTEGLALGAHGNITTTPFTIDTGVSTGNQPMSVFYLNRSTAGTVVLPALAAGNVNPLTLHYRVIWFVNIGTAAITLDGNASEPIQNGLISATTLTLYPGQSVCLHGRSSAWYVIGSHGMALGGTPTAYAATFSLTNAQIKALPTTYIEVVPAPGASKFLVFHRAAFFVDASAGAYTNVDVGSVKGLAIVYGDWITDCSTVYPWEGSGGVGAQLEPFSKTVNQPYDGEQFYPTSGMNVAGNTALKFAAWNDPGDYTGGNAANTLKGQVIYSIFDYSTGLFV